MSRLRLLFGTFRWPADFMFDSLSLFFVDLADPDGFLAGGTQPLGRHRGFRADYRVLNPLGGNALDGNGLIVRRGFDDSYPASKVPTDSVCRRHVNPVRIGRGQTKHRYYRFAIQIRSVANERNCLSVWVIFAWCILDELIHALSYPCQSASICQINKDSWIDSHFASH